MAKSKYPTAPTDGYTAFEQVRAAYVLSLLEPFFERANLNTFIDLSILPELSNTTDPMPNFVLVKVNKPIMPKAVRTQGDPARHPLCRVHYLYSAGLLFGYLLEIPRLVIKIESNFVSIKKPNADDTALFPAAKIISQNAHLTVFHSEAGASLVCFNELFFSLNPSVLKSGGDT